MTCLQKDAGRLRRKLEGRSLDGQCHVSDIIIDLTVCQIPFNGKPQAAAYS